MFKDNAKFKILFFSGLVAFSSQSYSQQAVTTVYGDYGSTLWSASGGTGSATANDINNVVGFSTVDGTFSTGVNDGLLDANSIPYTAQNFVAFPVDPAQVIPANGSLVGIPANWQGSSQTAASNTVDVSDLSLYMKDGAHGLDLSTMLFNVNTASLAGTQTGYEKLTYDLVIGSTSVITDNIPDLLVTQMGNVGTADVFRLIDKDGNTVGVPVSVDFTTVPNVYNQPSVLFRSADGVTRASGQIETRATRILSLKLSDFAINATNYRDIVGFEHILSGQSDIAFSAYNNL